jgi:hypothetical protein
MKLRFSSILGWLSIFLVAAFNTFAGIMKFVPVAPGSEAEAMMQKLGVSATLDHTLGVIELASVVLYVLPRTSTIGFVLLVGYMGGALATNLTHGFTNAEALPIYLTFLFLTIGAYTKNPELLSRLRNRPV